MFEAGYALLTTTSGGIDLSVADAIVSLTTKVLDLFTVFPLNIFLGASLVGIGVRVFSRLKRA